MLTTKAVTGVVLANGAGIETESVLGRVLRIAADAAGASRVQLVESTEGEDVTSGVPIGVDSMLLVLSGARPRELGLIDTAARLVRQAWVWALVAGGGLSSGGKIRRQNFLAWFGDKMEAAVDQTSELSLLLLEIEDRDPVSNLYGAIDLSERVPAVYNSVERAVRGVDSVYRCDDTTLAVVLPRCDRANAAKVAGRIRSAFDEAVAQSRRGGTVTGRLRTYAYPDDLGAFTLRHAAGDVAKNDPQSLLRVLMGIGCGALRARAALHVADSSGELRCALATGPGAPDVVPRTAEEAFLAGMAAILPHAGTGERTILALPLPGARAPFGLLLLESVHAGFGPGEVEIGKALAAHMAPIVEHSGLVETTTARPSSAGSSRTYKYSYDGIIGQSSAMREVYDLLERVIDTDYPVIVQGESGTGKELVARAIHFNGRRREKPLIAENCAALNDNLLEAELFGYEKGSFTGAETSRKGLFELADGGTLFLDEVADMKSGMQKDLLRILQEGIVRPVGGKKFLHVDVRIICASNKNLAQLVDEGKFRSDLFYRLNVWSIQMPALRERREDIPHLVEHFLGKIATQTATPSKRLGRGVMDALVSQEWPGNIRELKNEIARMVALSSGEEIQLRDLSRRPSGEVPRLQQHAAAMDRVDDILPLDEIEKLHILKALRFTNNNRARAAELLGINKATIYRKLKAYGLD